MALCSIIEYSINDLSEKENLRFVKAPGNGFCLIHSVLIALEHETNDIKVFMNKLKQQLHAIRINCEQKLLSRLARCSYC